MFNDVLSAGEAVSVVFTGIVVVFLALLLLIGFIYLMGAFFTAKGKKKTTPKKLTKTESKSEEPLPNEVIAAIAGAIAAQQSGVSGEVVAAIAAALTMIWEEEGNKNPFVIRSIKRVSGPARKAWNLAGVIDNTRPF